MVVYKDHLNDGVVWGGPSLREGCGRITFVPAGMEYEIPVGTTIRGYLTIQHGM